MIREFFEPRVALLFLVLWAILWGGTLLYLRATSARRERVIRRATVPIYSGVATLVVVIVLIAALTFFN